MKNFFESIPRSVEEQAMVDRAGTFRIFWSIVLPMALTKGVATLASGQLGQGNQYPLKLAAAAVMTVPVAVLFFIFQKRIMNVTDGAVKG